MDRTDVSGKVNITFLENFANELKVPVNIITGFTALLGEPELDAPTRESYQLMIIEAADRLMLMASDVQEICNIKLGKTSVELKPVRLNKVMASLYQKYMKSAFEKRIKLSLDLFERNGEVEVMTDAVKLQRIISNLLSNAIKFTSDGFVRFGYTMKIDFMEFHVSDNGIGIQSEFLENIFDHNFQNDNPTSVSYGGTGLGLYISKEYVELLGGKIYVSSTPGEGSVFRFTIPLKKSTIKSEDEGEKDVDKMCVFSEKKIILVAEDMDSNFMLITMLLKSRNVELLRAYNGREALDIVRSGRKIDLILMDIKMPEMDGLTATLKIREAGYAMPIIAQTAYIDDKQIAFSKGCNGFLSKPFDRRKLFSVIADFIQ